MNAEQPEHIEIARLDLTAQTRTGLREAAVSDYAEKIRSGTVMDPAVAFDDGEKLFLAGGFHRRAAYEKCGQLKMPCIVRKGSQWDAIEFGIADNLKHNGERLTNRDKEHNVKLVLRLKPHLTDAAIAQIAGVSIKTASKYRAELVATLEIPMCDEREDRQGRILKVTGIGRPSRNDASDECDLDSDNPPPVGTFELPELQPQEQYVAKGSGIGEFAAIIPHPEIPGFFFVAVLHKRGYLNFTRRGVNGDPSRIKDLLESYEFTQASPWKSSPATGEWPWYLPSCDEVREVEGRKLQFFRQHRELPSPGDDEFWSAPHNLDQTEGVMAIDGVEAKNEA